MEPANSEVEGRQTYVDIDVGTGYTDISKQLQCEVSEGKACI